MPKKMSEVKVEKITESLKVGEGPHWDERAQALYFVSIPEQAIHKYDAETQEHTKTCLDGRPGFIVPIGGQPDQFVVGLEREFVVVQWDGEEGSSAKVVRILGEIDHHAVENRINDGKVDPVGRLFAGTMGPEDSNGCFQLEKGSFYRLDESGITKICDKITVSNGLAWDQSGQVMYYIDSWEKNIRRYDYDIDTGNISNLKYVFDFKKNKIEGFPDGMTVDTDGNLWVAVFGGSCILQISPEGELLRRVSVPALQVTSCTFGGRDMDVLFVTTACIDGLGDKQQEPPSGCTYKITGLGVKGHPNGSFKLV